MNWKDVILLVLRRVLPARWYLSLRYRIIFGRFPDWRNPKTFTEKLQWLKLYGRRPEYTVMVDKLAAKDYVRGIVGDKYIVPTYAVWERSGDVDVSGLPEKFILKTNHASGEVVICRDRNHFNLADAQGRLAVMLGDDYWRMGMEIAYRDIPRRIFAEELLEHENGAELLDYKFFCFGGEVKFLKVNFGKDVDFRANYYDLDFRLLPFGERWPAPDPSRNFTAPENFGEMVDVAKRLSSGLPFARIDLYNVDGSIYFGEITLYPTSGFGPFDSEEWDLRLGEMIELPMGNA